MADGVGIETQLPDLAPGGLIVPSADGVGEEKLRGSRGRVDLDWQRNGGPDEDAILALLSDDERAFLDAELPSQPGGDDDGAPLADPAGLRSRSPDCLSLGHIGKPNQARDTRQDGSGPLMSANVVQVGVRVGVLSLEGD